MMLERYYMYDYTYIRWLRNPDPQRLNVGDDQVGFGYRIFYGVSLGPEDSQKSCINTLGRMKNDDESYYGYDLKVPPLVFRCRMSSSCLFPKVLHETMFFSM